MSPPVLLIAEDSQDDYLLLERAFNKSRVAASLQWAKDGIEAQQYLEQALAARSNFPPPALVLADVKMPRMDGFELLRWIKAQPGLRRIPVVVLSSSSQRADINRAYEMGANSYLVKPGSFQDLLKLSSCLQSYWMSFNAMPDAHAAPQPA